MTVRQRVAAVAAVVSFAAACGTAPAADDGSARSGDEATESAALDVAPAPSRAAGAATSTADGQQVVLAALDRASEPFTARTELVSTVRSDAGEVVVTAEGVVAGGDVEMTLAFGGRGQGFDVDVIVVDGVLYQRFPMLSAQLGAPEAEWLRTDLAAIGPEFADILETLETADPASALEVLEGVADVRVVGAEQVRGATTTHLVADVPLGDLLAAHGLDATADRGAAGDRAVAYDLWVDEQDRVRRLAFAFDLHDRSTSTVVDVLAYGIDVTVAPPPADATVSFDDLVTRD